MLDIWIPSTSLWNPNTERFVEINGQTLTLEHSLVSLSKWEAKWHKPMLGDTKLSEEEVFDYIRCMTINRNVNPRVYECLTNEQLDTIRDYIDDPHTATWFSGSEKEHGRKRPLTSELIYYYMISYGIPIECEKWHLNRLITLIRVCHEETKPQKKLSKSEIAARHKALNAARRKKIPRH